MKIIFQTGELNVEKVLESFTSKNRNSGAVISFLGKVRPSSNKKKSLNKKKKLNGDLESRASCWTMRI